MSSILFVRTGETYRPASKSEILEGAAEIQARKFELSRPCVDDPRLAKDFLVGQLSHCEEEHFCVLFLDTRHRVIAFDKMFRGTVDGASVHPREVVKAALAHNAAAVIFSHNHPSGIAEPSVADEVITQRLRDGLSLVEIRVLDHIIVAGDKTTSFVERGLI